VLLFALKKKINILYVDVIGDFTKVDFVCMKTSNHIC